MARHGQSLASSNPAGTAREGRGSAVFYGWWVVAVCFLLTTLSSGSAFYAFGLFIIPFQEEFSWSRGAVSGAISLHFLTVGLSGPLAGRLVDRYGPRYLMLTGLVLAGVSYLALSVISTLPALYGVWMLLAVGTAFFGVVPVGAVIARWFVRRRGLATGIAMTGIAFGGLALTPILGAVIEAAGWRPAAVALGLVLMTLPVPFVLLVLRRSPQQMGLLPYGGSEADVATARERRAAEGAWSPRAAVGTPAFWLASGAFLLASAATVGVLQHQAAFLRDYALAPTIAALGVGITSGIGGVGKVLFGYLSDRLPVRYAALLSFGSQAGALVLLLTTQEPWALWTYVALFGLGMGATVVLVPLLVAELFGTGRSFGVLFGATNMIQGLGLAAGPLAAGRIFDVSGSYTLAFQTSLALYFLATILVFLARRPQKPTPAARPSTVVPGVA